jgi:hypothetical protein
VRRWRAPSSGWKPARSAAPENCMRFCPCETWTYGCGMG